ncbi:MAG: hypothetical protein GF317_03290 [Candidatus Lokiarchaeota archaeon]|nr:hypothetical protein [Candidatus Lokiarchaeota archaeon]MBD3198928.1 hypothetical protein [Candidatus Lokiarchaeota archaeon]
MVQGLAIFSWDQKMGSVLDVKYPETLKLAPDLTNKIYMTHAYDQTFEKAELIEINYKEDTIISYCDKSRVPEFGYEVLVLILSEKEKHNLYQLKKKFTEFGKKIFELESKEREEFFLENIDQFYTKSSAKKLLLLGRAGTGKTTIKKIIFEGKNPKDLIYNPLEPTRGISPSVYSWFDLKLGLFDTSGQELEALLNANLDDQKLAFENADIVIYLLDFPLWVAKKNDIIQEIKKIEHIIKENDYSSQVVVFIHKIDLIEDSERESVLEQTRKEFKENLSNSVYFTSIYLKLIYNLYNAFHDLLSTFSEDTGNLRDIIDNEIADISKIMCYITNEKDSIIVQSMSDDFDTYLINHTHKMIAQLTESFENMAKNENIAHLIISGRESINTIMYYLELSKFNLKNLVCISETLSANKLIVLVGKLRGKLNSYYFYNKKGGD